MTFEDWINKVDTIVWETIGCSLHDLPDCPLRDWYEQGCTPEQAAKKAIKYAKA